MSNKGKIISEAKMTMSPNIAKQRGVVLVVSLVFLVALTAVAAALMQNSTTDMKMSGASEEKVVALQEVVSAVDEVIFNQVFSCNILRVSANRGYGRTGQSNISANSGIAQQLLK